MTSVEDKKVLIVTGGSRGIGAEISRLGASKGYRVVVNYSRSAKEAEMLVDELKAGGHQAHGIACDVSREEDVLRLFAETRDTFGSVSVLINNAGITGGFARVRDVSAKTLNDIMAINVVGAFLCSREAIRQMSTETGGAGGSIINVSSRASLYGGAGEWVHYGRHEGGNGHFDAWTRPGSRRRGNSCERSGSWLYRYRTSCGGRRC